MPESTPEKPGGNLNADIAALRLGIDALDEKILDLINRRLLLAQQIGDVKKQSGIQIADRRREIDIMDRLLLKNTGPLSDDGLRRIFTAIIAEGRSVQIQSEGKND
jgi:chorismate mutase/prephenate dehydratase